MLHRETVSPRTLELLRDLQSLKPLTAMRLVGGTSLSLQYGHRISTDLDLFGDLGTTATAVLDDYLSTLGDVVTRYHTPSIHAYLINGVKVDIVNYRYPWLQAPLEIDGLKLASKLDVAAMKLNAITGRGTKKDFVDLFFLIKDFSFTELFDAYGRKYTDGNEFLVLRSLSYFDDADETEVEMVVPITWRTIKEELMNQIQKYYKEIGYN